MRRQERQILEDVEQLQKNQLYLMEQPSTPQQMFLHLMAHKHLLDHSMMHKNLDKCLSLLPGSFAQNSLLLSYSALCLDHKIQVPEEGSPLLTLISNWVNYYSTLRNKKNIRIGQVVLQESTSTEDIQGYELYLQYVSLISLDLWKVITRGKTEKEFMAERPLKEEVDDIKVMNKRHLDASDLLTFVSSCIPKTVLNIILEKASLPYSMREDHKSYECLFVNQGVEYYLRKNLRLALLLKTIMLCVLQMELSPTLLKFLMLVAMRFYYMFHYNRRLSAAEIFVYAYNKITDEVRRSMADQFALFIKVILKLGKQKFTAFLGQNSPFLSTIIEASKNKGMIGYPQEAASPYNTIGIAQTIKIDRGASKYRYFEVLEEYSLFYYRIVIANHDVNIRLYYLGEIGSQQESKSLLFSQQKKSGTVKNCINAMKKGLYMFEFDNSYSWLNGKSIRYQNVVYSPLEIKSSNADQWIEDLYGGLYQNQIANSSNIFVVKPGEKKSSNEKLQGAVISKGEGTYTLLLNAHLESSYQYETDDSERMIVKIKRILKKMKDLQLIVDQKKVDLEGVRSFLNQSPLNKPKQPEKIEPYKEEEEEKEVEKEEKPKVEEKSQKTEKKQEEKQAKPEKREEEKEKAITIQAPKVAKKSQISPDESSANLQEDTQSELVPKQLDDSVIINKSQPIKEKSQEKPSKKKEVISYNSNEQNDFYDQD